MPPIAFAASPAPRAPAPPAVPAPLGRIGRLIFGRARRTVQADSGRPAPHRMSAAHVGALALLSL